MSEMGQKAKFRCLGRMSALLQKADTRRRARRPRDDGADRDDVGARPHQN
jgi:hypothetical protein